MKRRALALALAGVLVSGLAPRAAAQLVNAQVISTSHSNLYSEVTCTSSDTMACADALQLADDTRDQLSGLLKLTRHWRFPVHIHLMAPEDPLLAKVNREAAAVFADGEFLKIEAVVPSTDPEWRRFVQKQYVTALLFEKFFANTKDFDTNTKLDAVPVWLVEGLTEWLNEDPDHNRESIVKRAVLLDKAPSLAEIKSWSPLSTDRLQGAWQRAFCFYLLDSLIQPGKRRGFFQQWLDTYAGPNPAKADNLFPREDGWRRELLEASQRSHPVVYTWDETAAELAVLEVIGVPGTKPADTRVCTMDTVTTNPMTPALAQVMKKKIFDLTALELRAHPTWRAILMQYRFGLTAFANDSTPEQGKKLIQQAHDMRAAEMDRHQKLVDYINWFEVTKIVAGNNSHFQTYFSTAEEMEKTQADPKHPNPIRANLLQVEAQLEGGAPAN